MLSIYLQREEIHKDFPGYKLGNTAEEGWRWHERLEEEGARYEAGVSTSNVYIANHLHDVAFIRQLSKTVHVPASGTVWGSSFYSCCPGH